MIKLSEPRISVIIPTLNSSKKIDKCLQAVFTQSIEPHEVIIVDAHSRDSTIEKATKFPVKVFLQDYGACGAARQIGLENATGGGHEEAAGAKVRVEDLEKFRKRLDELNN